MEKNWAKFLSLKENNFKTIEICCSKESLILYKRWISWLLNQKNYSNNTISSYSYDFKYFLNFISKHFSINKVKVIDFQKLQVKDFRSWLAFLKNTNPSLKAKSIARSRASIKSFYFYCILIKKINASEIYNLDNPKLPKSLPKAISERQIIKVLNLLKKRKKYFFKVKKYCINIYTLGLWFKDF